MEYVLLLVITVSLILSLTNQFFKPFGAFVNNYMGDYISCLLETGEFPTTGNSPNSQSECDFKFDPATFKDGRQPASGGSASDGNSSGRKKSGQGDNSSAGAGSYAGSAGQRASNLNSGPPSRGNGDSGGGQTKVVEISIGSTPEAGFNARSSSSAFGVNGGAARGAQVITYGITGSDQKKHEDDKKGGTRTIASEGSYRSPKKMTLKPPSKDAVLKEDKNEELNIGDYFRYLLIAAIIILLIAVIGGQAARLTKSWE